MRLMKGKQKAKKGIDELFFPEPVEIKTLSGEIVQVPKVAWGKEIRIGQEIGRVFEELNDVRISTEKGAQWDREKLIAELIVKAPDAVTRIVSIIIDKDAAWIQEELDAEAILGLLVPFCMNRVTKFVKVLPAELQDLHPGLTLPKR
jgi:hypothetical protein